MFPDDSTIAPGDVYVVAHSSADAVIVAVTDKTFNSLSNGDDGVALVMGTPDSHVYVDWIGDFNGDPGSGWSVCGESNATKDHTLLRKCDVTSGAEWSVSSSEESCQWTVLPKDTWDGVSAHEVVVFQILVQK